jgi:hypothetical protein
MKPANSDNQERIPAMARPPTPAASLAAEGNPHLAEHADHHEHAEHLEHADSHHVDSPPQLKLACPKCGASGTAPITHLGHYFICKRCEQWYRVEGSSFVAVRKPPAVVDLRVRMGFSDYRGDRYRETRPVAMARRIGRRLWNLRYPLGVAAAVIVAMLILYFARYRPAKTEQVAALPNTLEDRVPVWIDAWVANDVPRLMQLTAPSHDRQLRQWVSHNRPPRQTEGNDGAKSEVNLTSIKPRGKEAAEVVAVLSATDPSGQPQRVTLRQTWISSDGAWYFLPPVAVKAHRQ